MSRILVIDDDSGHRLILKSRLHETGHEAVLVDSGAKGLVEARSQPFDAFLVAARLGKGVDGYEVCRRLKGIPERAHVPVILFNDSGNLHDDPTRAFEAGCDSYVTKPDLPALDHVLRVHLRAKKRIEELSREIHALHEQVRRAHHSEERPRVPEPNGASPEACADPKAVLQELAAGRPDGVVVVDAEGSVRFADRGACELLGSRLEGMHLGSLAPASGLEAYVRDARVEAREGFRFDLPPRKGRTPRSLQAVVVPLLVQPTSEHSALRVVLLLDAGKRRLAAELMRVSEPGVPRAELAPLVEAARERYRPESLVGTSAAAQRLRDDLNAALRHGEPVLLRGDRASGLDRVARTLHYSGNATGAFVHVRCAAFAPENLEAHLFGVQKANHGTGSNGNGADRPGAFQWAQDGTLFLEDVGELAPELQERLVRFLETGTVQRKGAQRPERIDLRLIVSAHHPLENAVAEGRFSRDLFGRISAHMIQVPTLSQRREDVEAIALDLLGRFGGARRVAAFDDSVLEFLRRHDWTGSVAELEDTIHQACSIASGGVVHFEDLPRNVREARGRSSGDEIIPARRAVAARPVEGTHAIHDTPIHELQPRPSQGLVSDVRMWDITDADPVSFDVYEKKVILRAIDQCEGDKLAAARLLGVGKSTLYRKLKYHGIK